MLAGACSAGQKRAGRADDDLPPPQCPPPEHRYLLPPFQVSFPHRSKATSSRSHAEIFEKEGIACNRGEWEVP